MDVTRTSDVRAREGVFSHDGKSVFAFADKSGEVELWRFPANGVGEARQLTKGASVLRSKAFPSPDGKWVAHFDKDRRLYLLNPASGEDKVIDRSPVGGYEEVAWSIDSRWLAFSKSAENSFESLHLLEVSTGKITPLTSDRYDARDAAFSTDGKWLFFLGNRNLKSVVTSPWGQRNPEPFFDRQTKIYALALDPAARWPFLPKDELQKPEPDKKPEPPKSAAAADAVPPVARTSSITSTRSVLVSASSWISSASVPYSRTYSLRRRVHGSFPGLRIGMNPVLSARATQLPKMNPRDSIPATLVMLLVRNGSTRASMVFCRARADFRSGVMSLKMIPGFGKSGTSRMKRFSSSPAVIRT